MMYSISPLPPIDTLNSHEGFWAAVIFGTLATAFVSFLFWVISDNERIPRFIMGIWIFLVLPFIAYNSWNAGSIVAQKNEEVQGEFVGYFAEGYISREKSGKTTRDIEHHYVYVTYEVEGKTVVFRTEEGLSWPKQAIFYRN